MNKRTRGRTFRFVPANLDRDEHNERLLPRQDGGDGVRRSIPKGTIIDIIKNVLIIYIMVIDIMAQPNVNIRMDNELRIQFSTFTKDMGMSWIQYKTHSDLF